VLDVWLASQRRYAPVALNQQGARSSWVRPMKAGLEVDDSAEARLRLTLALNSDISYLQEGEQLVVQRFADQKSSRRGSWVRRRAGSPPGRAACGPRSGRARPLGGARVAGASV